MFSFELRANPIHHFPAGPSPHDIEPGDLLNAIAPVEGLDAFVHLLWYSKKYHSLFYEVLSWYSGKYHPVF